ncbi:hypothetical protein LCGC14_2692830, partial [marine sediment metagenome]
MAVTCLFCNYDVTNDGGSGFAATQTLYMCHRCGPIHLANEDAEHFHQA